MPYLVHFLMPHIAHTELQTLHLESHIWIAWAEFFAVIVPLKLIKK